MKLSKKDFVNFITAHENHDIADLLLSKDKWSGIDMRLAVNAISIRRRLKTKVPSWYAVPELEFPLPLSAEQCSSEETAAAKASLTKKILTDCIKASKENPSGTEGNRNRGFRIADLTGGMGIDSFEFSKIAEKVLYNEMNPVLALATKENFKILGRDNIVVSNKMIVPSSKEAKTDGFGDTVSDKGPETITPTELLKDFLPDLIYMDPARRDASGKKVFLIEDCSPDILTMKDELLSLSRLLMIKLSPMADINMVLERLGQHCREVHITSSGGECKELIVIMDREWKGECRIYAGSLDFLRSEEKTACACYPDSIDEIINAGYLFEPDKALLKSGAFNLMSSRLKLVKLAKSTHLYIADSQEDAMKCRDCGKVFRILRACHLNKGAMKSTGKEFPEAEVTARNIPMNSELLRKKLGVRSGGNVHVFGAGVEYGKKKESFLFITERIL